MDAMGYSWYTFSTLIFLISFQRYIHVAYIWTTDKLISSYWLGLEVWHMAGIIDAGAGIRWHVLLGAAARGMPRARSVQAESYPPWN